MRLTAHFIASSLLALVLYPFLGLVSLFVFVSGFLIDIDHYPVYVMRSRSLNPFKANRYFTESRLHNTFCLFHTIEFFILVAAFAVFTSQGRVLFLGLAVHQLMDVYNENKLGRSDAKVKSMIWYFLRK